MLLNYSERKRLRNDADRSEPNSKDYLCNTYTVFTAFTLYLYVSKLGGVELLLLKNIADLLLL